MPISSRFGAGDILVLIGLALQCYNDCKEAGGQFEEIGYLAWTFHSALETIHIEISNANSALAQRSRRSKQVLVDTINECEGIIGEVSALLAIHGSLDGTRESSRVRRMTRAWDRARFSATEMSERLHAIGSRLTSHITTIMLQLDDLQVFPTGQIPKALDATRSDMRDGLAGIRTAIFTVARRIRTNQEESDSSSGPSSLGDDGWREIKQELLRQNIGKREISRCKRVLLFYIRQRPMPMAEASGEAERRARSRSSSGSQVSSKRGRRRERGRRKGLNNRHPSRFSPLPDANVSPIRPRDRSRWSSSSRTAVPPRPRSRRYSRGPYMQYAEPFTPRHTRRPTKTEMVLFTVAAASVSYIVLSHIDKRKGRR